MEEVTRGGASFVVSALPPERMVQALGVLCQPISAALQVGLRDTEIMCLGFWVLGFGFWVLGFGLRVKGFGVWGLGFGFWGEGDFC